MLNLELLKNAQNLIRKVMKDQPGVIAIDANCVQLDSDAYLDAFRDYKMSIDGNGNLHLSAYHDGVEYVAAVLVDDPFYIELKEKAPTGADTEKVERKSDEDK